MTDTAESTQIGGDHYKKLAIQPMRYSELNNLSPCQHTAIKYITRFRDKNENWREDLEKAKHCIDLLIELETERRHAQAFVNAAEDFTKGQHLTLGGIQPCNATRDHG